MMRATPQTIGNELTAAVNALMHSSYLHPDDLRLQVLRLRLDTLATVDLPESLLLRAFLEHFTGNIERVEEIVEAAVAAGATEARVAAVRGPTLINLGYFSRARGLLSSAADPRKGSFSSLRTYLLWSGAVIKSVEYARESEKMGMAQAEDAMIQLSHRAAEILQEHQVSDGELSEILDLAGEVMRRHRAIFVGAYPELEVLEDERPPIVHMTFPLELPPSEVADANFELAELFALREGFVPEVLHVSFTVSA